MKKAAHTKIGNKASVSTKPTSANRRMNPMANASLKPTPANRKMNAPGRVKPAKH